MAKFETVALVKGCDESISKKDGRVFRNVHFYGTEGRPADFKTGANEDSALWEKAKKALYQKCRVVVEITVYEGNYNFNLVSLDPLVAKS